MTRTAADDAAVTFAALAAAPLLMLVALLLPVVVVPCALSFGFVARVIRLSARLARIGRRVVRQSASASPISSPTAVQVGG